MRYLFFVSIFFFTSCFSQTEDSQKSSLSNSETKQIQKTFADSLVDAALYRTTQDIEYVPSYFRIDYPNGDIPKQYGVCTDLVIRSYRALRIDLQKLVHEDMKANFSLYPKNWGLSTTDKNIDHRRVPNLMKFFERHGKTLSKSENKTLYKPGDIVCWNLGGGITHIGIVVNQKSSEGVPLIAHNIGSGPVISDCLFSFTIIGHYRYGRFL